MTLRRAAHRWLLWLAFLLPIAQAMAGAHALSHAGGAEAQHEGIALVHCDLCVAAAGLVGGPPAAESAPLPAAVRAAGPLPAPAAASIRRPAGWQPPARAPPVSA